MLPCAIRASTNALNAMPAAVVTILSTFPIHLVPPLQFDYLVDRIIKSDMLLQSFSISFTLNLKFDSYCKTFL